VIPWRPAVVIMLGALSRHPALPTSVRVAITIVLGAVALALLVVLFRHWRARGNDAAASNDRRRKETRNDHDGPSAATGETHAPSVRRLQSSVVDTISLEFIDEQEDRFSRAFAAGDIKQARGLYHPEVVYLSPTVRLFQWPEVIEGVDATLEFIQLTIQRCRNINYRLDERAVLPDGRSAYTRIFFDWDTDDARQRSIYVVLYRYREGRIGQQELYYDPDGKLERLGDPTR
jgi:ketosteroid isomerase-like protein